MSIENKAAKISVIIPMYYCEEYIWSLLEYLCRQPFSDIEIICIDDGSPDGSSDIVKGYSAKDNRIKLISQEHKGAGAARNTGIEHAAGEYVLFLDADDEYDESYVSRMYEAIDKNHADIAVCQFTVDDSMLGRTAKNSGYSCVTVPADKAIPTRNVTNLATAVSVVPHCKIIRRSLIEDNNLLFTESKSMNDMVFSVAAMICAESIVFLKDSLMTYKHHRNPKSISSSRGNNPQDHVLVCHDLYKWLLSRGLQEEHKRTYWNKWGSALHTYGMYCTDECFIQNAVSDIVSGQPWKGLSNRELFFAAKLYTAPSRKMLRKERHKLSNSNYSQQQREMIGNNCRYIEREIENVTKVRKMLEDEYGRSFFGMDNLLVVRIMQVKEAGLRRTLEIFYRKIVNRML